MANPARRRRQRKLATAVGLVLLVGFGVWFSVTVLFKINRYEVQGDTFYTQEQVVEAFGHTIGDNLFGFSVKSAEERIETALPYVEEVSIRRMPPSTVVFRLTPAKEAYYLQWQDSFVVLNATGKVLRQSGEEPEGLVRIEGLSCLQVQEGHPIGLDEEAAKAAVELKRKLEESVKSLSGEDGAASSVSQSESAPEASSSAPSESSSATGESSSSQSEGTTEPAPWEVQENPTVWDMDEEGIPQKVTVSPEAMAAIFGEEAAAAMAQQTEQQEQQKQQLEEFADQPDPELAAESYEVMWQLLQTFEEYGLDGVSWLDVSDPLELRFGWEDRIAVELGGKSSLGAKMDALLVLLNDPAQGLEAGDRGTLDMRYYPEGNVIYRPE